MFSSGPERAPALDRGRLRRRVGGREARQVRAQVRGRRGCRRQRREKGRGEVRGGDVEEVILSRPLFSRLLPFVPLRRELKAGKMLGGARDL